MTSDRFRRRTSRRALRKGKTMTERNITKKRRVKKKKEEEEKKEKEEDEKDDDDLEDSADQKSVASDTPGKTASLSSVN